MRYFMYSPLDLDEQTAYNLARPYLREGVIVHVASWGTKILEVEPGQTPRAAMNHYLVRVEQDGSLRTVHVCFDDVEH